MFELIIGLLLNNTQPLPCGFIIYHVGGRDRDRLDTQVLKSQAATRPILRNF